MSLAGGRPDALTEVSFAVEVDCIMKYLHLGSIEWDSSIP